MFFNKTFLWTHKMQFRQPAEDFPTKCQKFSAQCPEMIGENFFFTNIVSPEKSCEHEEISSDGPAANYSTKGVIFTVPYPEMIGKRNIFQKHNFSSKFENQKKLISKKYICLIKTFLWTRTKQFRLPPPKIPRKKTRNVFAQGPKIPNWLKNGFLEKFFPEIIPSDTKDESSFDHLAENSSTAPNSFLLNIRKGPKTHKNFIKKNFSQKFFTKRQKFSAQYLEMIRKTFALEKLDTLRKILWKRRVQFWQTHWDFSSKA